MTVRWSTLAVAVIDDDMVIRLGLPLLLPPARSIRSFADVETFLDAAPEVDAVLVDLVLTGTGRQGVRQGAAGVRAVAASGYRALIYTNEHRREVLAGCLAAGARGVIHKAEEMPALVSAITAVAAGGTVITPALVGLAEVVERRGGMPALSPRQREVLSGRARGQSFQAIADRLYISRRTAEEHMNLVAAKFVDYLSTHSAADLERHLGIGPGDLMSP